MKLITPEIQQRFDEVGDQSEKENPVFITKFFDPCSSATWYVSEYDPETNICYGYITRLVPNIPLCDEWGSFSIEELESIQHPFERDIHYKEKTFEEQFNIKTTTRVSEITHLTSSKNQEQDIEY